MQISARSIHGENKTLQAPRYLCPCCPQGVPLYPHCRPPHQSRHPAHGCWHLSPAWGKGLWPLCRTRGVMGCLALPQNRTAARLSLGNEDERPKCSPESAQPGDVVPAAGHGMGTIFPSGNMTYPGEGVACGVGISAGGGGRGVCELEREKDFFGLACFAAERRFQLQG